MESTSRHTSCAQKSIYKGFLWTIAVLNIILCLFIMLGLAKQNANAASVYGRFKIDVSGIDTEEKTNLRNYVNSFNKSIYPSNNYQLCASFMKKTVFSGQSSPSQTVFDSTCTRIYDDATGVIDSNSIHLEPGEYIVNYNVSSTSSLSIYSSYINAYQYYNPYYKTAPLENRDLILDNGYPVYNSNYTYSSLIATVQEDGRIIDQNGNDFQIKIEPVDYTESGVSIDVAVKSLKDAIPENEKLVAKLMRFRSGRIDTTAESELALTGEGTYKVNFDVDIPKNTMDGTDSISHYCIEYKVVDASGNQDLNWSSYTCDRDEKQFIKSNYDYIPDRQNRIGIIDGRVGTIGYLDNDSYLHESSLKYVSNFGYNNLFIPYIITLEYNYLDLDNSLSDQVSSEDGKEKTTEFHRAESVNDFKDGNHYIIAAKNYVDGTYYALSTDGYTYATKLTDLNDQNLDSYMLSDDTLNNSNYVFKVKDTVIDGPTALAKFVSNISSDTGRKKTLKIKSDSNDLQSMFDGLGGARVLITNKDGQNDETLSGFDIRKANGKYALSFVDVFGHGDFNYLYYSSPLIKTNRSFQSEENYIKISGDRKNYINGCSVITVKALSINSGEYCSVKLDNPDLYNSQAYFENNSKNTTAPLIILTDAEIEDSEIHEQLVEATYSLVEGINQDENYKGLYNGRFLLDYVDNDGNNHILSATDSIIGNDGRTYYPGKNVTLNSNGTITTFVKDSFSYNDEEDIKEEASDRLKLRGIKQNDERNSNPYLTIDSDSEGNYISYASSRKEMSFYFNEDNTLYLRGSKSDRFVGWGSFTDENGVERTGFVSVPTKDEAIKFKIYSVSTYSSNNRSTINFYNQNDIEESYIFDLYNQYSDSNQLQNVLRPTNYGRLRNVYLGGAYELSTEGASRRLPLPVKVGTVDENGNVFAGYTLNQEKSGIVADETDIENIYNNQTGLDDNFMAEYEIVNNDNYFTPESVLTPLQGEYKQLKYGYNAYSYAHADLYPVYVKHAINDDVAVNDEDGNLLLSVSDWKENQEDTSPREGEKDTQVWQGAITVKTYLDGEPYGEEGKIHYQYHNDNAADVLINLADNSEFVIDAILAEQSSGEEGLKYAYNWITEKDVSLDNVKGGSTVRIYLSSNPEIQLHYNDEELEKDVSGYRIISGGTLRAIREEGLTEVINMGINDEELAGLIDKNITMVGNSAVYKPLNGTRNMPMLLGYTTGQTEDNNISEVIAEKIGNRRVKSAWWQAIGEDGSIIMNIDAKDINIETEEELVEFFRDSFEREGIDQSPFAYRLSLYYSDDNDDEEDNNSNDDDNIPTNNPSEPEGNEETPSNLMVPNTGANQIQSEAASMSLLAIPIIGLAVTVFLMTKIFKKKNN